MIRTFGVVTDTAHPLMVACASVARTDFRANRSRRYSRELRNLEKTNHSKTSPPATIHVVGPRLTTQS
jgi:hypothetical protein